MPNYFFHFKNFFFYFVISVIKNMLIIKEVNSTNVFDFFYKGIDEIY